MSVLISNTPRTHEDKRNFPPQSFGGAAVFGCCSVSRKPVTLAALLYDWGWDWYPLSEVTAQERAGIRF